jgi:methyltransferase
MRQVDIALLAVFGLLQVGRVWVLLTLGERWTTRIIVLPGAPLVRSGPYRFVSHPNYWIVAGEILVLPLAFGLVAFALAFSALNALMLWVRIRAENAALRGAQRQGNDLERTPAARNSEATATGIPSR